MTKLAHGDHPLRHFDRTCPACLHEKGIKIRTASELARMFWMPNGKYGAPIVQGLSLGKEETDIIATALVQYAERNPAHQQLPQRGERMKRCPECCAFDGMHWEWCNLEPMEKWAGVISSKKMTPEEIAKEYPGATLPAAADEGGKNAK